MVTPIVCDCESMDGRFGAHRPECPRQIAFEKQLAKDNERYEQEHEGEE